MIAITDKFRKPPQGLRIGRVSDIEIKVHWSWLAAFSLVFFAVYQFFHSNLESSLIVKAFGTLLVTFFFFLSVTMHELAHSMVARRWGVRVKEITLFIFGGIAWMGQESDSPSAEIRIAASGPIFSFLAFVVSTGLALLCSWRGLDAPSLAFTLLAMINFGLTFFNLLPAFPLDGGRILRALLWKRWGDPIRSTVIASRIGQAFATALIIAGVSSTFLDLYQSGYDKVTTALWLIFIGVFLFQLARVGGRRSAALIALSTTRVIQKMRPWGDQGIDVEHPVEIYLQRVEPPQNTKSEREGAIDGDASLLQALRKMECEGRSFLLVERGGGRVGIIRIEDIQDFLKKRVAQSTSKTCI